LKFSVAIDALGTSVVAQGHDYQAVHHAYAFRILQGTQELKDALKKPEAIAALCNVVVTAQDAQIRQYAAVVLGRRMAKYKHWAKLTAEDRAV